MEKMILAKMPVASSCDAETLDFETLVYTYGHFVMSVAYAVIRNSEDAEDVAQETFSGLIVPATWAKSST